MLLGELVADFWLAPQSALGADQLSWLLNDLARVNRAVTPWVTVSWHQPPVSPLIPLTALLINFCHAEVDTCLQGGTRLYYIALAAAYYTFGWKACLRGGHLAHD